MHVKTSGYETFSSDNLGFLSIKFVFHKENMLQLVKYEICAVTLNCYLNGIYVEFLDTSRL